MPTKIEVTGHGSTQAEARADAQHKMNDAKTDQMAFDTASSSLGLIWMVIFGYGSLAWQFVLNFIARPIATMMLLVVLALIGFGLYSVWPESDPATPVANFFWALFLIVVGSGAAAGLAEFVSPMTDAVEHGECWLIERLPAFLRVPLMTMSILWPTIALTSFYGAGSGWSFAGLWVFITTDFDLFGFIVIHLIWVSLQSVVVFYRTENYPLRHIFHWNGTRRLD